MFSLILIVKLSHQAYDSSHSVYIFATQYILQTTKQQPSFAISTAITQHLRGEWFVDTESLRIRDKNPFNY